MLQKVLFHWHLIIVLCNCQIFMLKLFSFKNAIFVESYCVHCLGVILRRDSYTCWSDINELILNMIQTTKTIILGPCGKQWFWDRARRCAALGTGHLGWKQLFRDQPSTHYLMWKIPQPPLELWRFRTTCLCHLASAYVIYRTCLCHLPYLLLSFSASLRHVPYLLTSVTVPAYII